MSVFSGWAPMCRAGPSAHGRISTALSAEEFSHDSADPSLVGPDRMCNTAPPAALPPRCRTSGPDGPAPTPRTRTRHTPALPHHRITLGPPRDPSGEKGVNDAIPRECRSSRAPESYAPATFFRTVDAPGLLPDSGGGIAGQKIISV